MNPSELFITFICSFVIILAGWNPAKTQRASIEKLDRVNHDSNLAQLHALLEVSPNFQVAFQKWISQSTIDSDLDARLQQVLRLSQNHGLSAAALVKYLEQRKELQEHLYRQWDEFSSPAKATSKLLIALPIVTHVIALSLGIHATVWMFSNMIGLGLFLCAILLSYASIYIQRRNPFKEIRTSSWSAGQAAIAVFLVICIWQPVIQGIIVAAIISLIVLDAWSVLLNQSKEERLREERFDHTWQLNIVICALKTGMNWPAALELIEGELRDSRRQEIYEIRLRLEQGATPEEAFSKSELWSDIAKTLSYAQRDGARLVPVLNALASSIMNDYKSVQEIRIRKRSQMLTVVVSALQLPAFIAVGLVPIAAEPIAALLQQFSSTVPLS